MPKFPMLAGTMLAGVMFAGVVRSSGGEETAAPPKRTKVVRSEGVIRVIGPDGKVQERRFGPSAAPQIEGLEEKLEELRSAAGDREAVERLSQELLELVQSAGSVDGAAERMALDGANLPELPKFSIGVSLAQEVPAALRAQLKLGDQEGVLVQSVPQDGPAAKAGIKEYDVLLAVDGTVIKQHSDMVSAVQQAGEAKSAVKLDYISGGEHKSTEVTPLPSNEINWVFATDFERTAEPSPRGLSFRMHPGLMQPQLQFENFPPVDLQFSAPHSGQKKLEERIEKLEQQLETLSKKLSAAESK